MTLVAITVAMVAGGHPATGQQPHPAPAAPPQAQHHPAARPPLEVLAQQTILVLPVQYLTFADSLNWSAQIPSIPAYLHTLDDELTFAFGERGLKKRWVFADGIARSMKRNPLIGIDPYALDAAQVRIDSKPDDWQLHDPLASQLRSLIALSDARYVLLPVELRLTSVHGQGQAKLHVVLIDARQAQLQWAGDIFGAPMPHFTPAVAADIASRFADLVAPPPH
jgi:hypothetical protein